MKLWSLPQLLIEKYDEKYADSKRELAKIP